MSSHAIITARGGAKSLPGKNIRPIACKPMIAWNIEAARQAQSVARVWNPSHHGGRVGLRNAAGKQMISPAPLSR